MQKNFVLIGKQEQRYGETLEREFKVSTNNPFNALLLVQKHNKKWTFNIDDMYEANVLWEKVEEIEEVEDDNEAVEEIGE